MAIHDYVIDNQSASAFRSDLNNALQAIVTQNSSATAPTTTYANMIWYDTAANQLKKRNEANSAWIILGTVDEALGTFTPSGTGKAFLGNTQFLTANTTLTSADSNDLLVCSASITVTLPAVSEGLVFGFVNNSDALVVIDTPNSATTVGRSPGGVLLLARQEAIVVCDGANWQIIGAEDPIRLQTVQFPATGTYVPNPAAKLFLACANGATGGTCGSSNTDKGGSGGGGYSEKLYTAPFSASYSVTIGAAGGAGGSSGTAGGTTTFGPISIPGSAGTNSTGNGGVGAAGTGGDFNATGGNGGNGASRGGGGGGSATRAGNGGNGSAGGSTTNGAGGGTGGNNAVGATSGAAATSVSGSAYSLTYFANTVTFRGGSLSGASSYNLYSGLGTDFIIGSLTSGGGSAGNNNTPVGGTGGAPGHVTIVEIF